MTFGASVRWGALWFRNPAVLGRGTLPVAAALVIWIVVSAAFLRPAAVIVSGFVMMTLLQIRAAMEYFKAGRRYRFIGAMLSGAGVAGIVIVNNIAAGVAIANRGLGDASTSVSYFNGVSAALLVLGMHLLIFEDLIDELRAAAAELARGRDEMKAMAVTDPLTRCYNRRFLDEIAHHELQQHRRYGWPLSLLYLDIDHFKAINDTRGHQTGDMVLETLGAILRARTRQADYVFRWGGDEFLVLLSADEAEAREKAEAIRQAFLESPIVRDLPDGVDLSIGCVAVPPETETFEPLIDQADREMYRRKRACELTNSRAEDNHLYSRYFALSRRQRASAPDQVAATTAGSSPRFTRSKLSREPSRRSVFSELILVAEQRRQRRRHFQSDSNRRERRAVGHHHEHALALLPGVLAR